MSTAGKFVAFAVTFIAIKVISEAIVTAHLNKVAAEALATAIKNTPDTSDKE